VALRTRVRRSGGYAPGYGGSFVSSAEQATRDLEARKQYNPRFDPALPDENFAGTVWAGGNRFFDEALNVYVYMSPDGRRVTSPTALAPDAAVTRLAATPVPGAPPTGGGGGAPPSSITTPGTAPAASTGGNTLGSALNMGGSVVADNGTVVTVRLPGGQTVYFNKTTGQQVAGPTGPASTTSTGGTAPPAGGAAPPGPTGPQVGEQISAQTSSGQTVTGTVTAVGPNGEITINWADGSVAQYGSDGRLISATPPPGAQTAGGETTTTGGMTTGGTAPTSVAPTEGAGTTTAAPAPLSLEQPAASTLTGSFDQGAITADGGGGGGMKPLASPIVSENVYGAPPAAPTTAPSGGDVYLDPGATTQEYVGPPSPTFAPQYMQEPAPLPQAAPTIQQNRDINIGAGTPTAGASQPAYYTDRFGNRVTLEQLMAQTFSVAAQTPPQQTFVEPPLWYSSQIPGSAYLDPGYVEPPTMYPPTTGGGGNYLTE
jgi:hypothetical protein